MFYTVIYHKDWGFPPRVWKNFEIDKKHIITFVLYDEVKVRLVNPPHPKLVGVEGKWGELKKKLDSLVLEPVNFTLEVIDKEGYHWLCVPSQIIDGVNKLRGKVSRRNRLIQSLRAKAGIL